MSKLIFSGGNTPKCMEMNKRLVLSRFSSFSHTKYVLMCKTPMSTAFQNSRKRKKRKEKKL